MAGLGQILGDQANTGWDWLHDANRDTLLVYKASTRNASPPMLQVKPGPQFHPTCGNCFSAIIQLDNLLSPTVPDKMTPWSVKTHPLDPPTLEQLVPVIDAGLKTNFKNATVEVISCPDLRGEPFWLAAKGLSGNERIADIGGPSNLHPLPKFDRKYSLLDMMKWMEMGKGFVLGAAAGPFHVIGVNSELMPNLSHDQGEVTNLTRFAKVDGERCVCEHVPENSTDCALMANLFGSEGRTGDVIKIVAKGRTGKLNFLSSIQEALKAFESPVSMGGVFLIRKGKAYMHVMPDFSKTPLDIDQMGKWLKFFEMSAPLVCLTTFHSRDPGLGLRMEHTHCFSDHGEGGHYHADTTPDEVEYEAYLNTAKVIYRIDQPGH
jgi:hypothetical protein